MDHIGDTWVEILSVGPGDPTGSPGSRSPRPPSTTVRAQATGGGEDGGDGKCGNKSNDDGRGAQNGKDLPRGRRKKDEDATFSAKGGRATQGLEEFLAFPRRGGKVVDVPQALLGLVPHCDGAVATPQYSGAPLFDSMQTFQYHRSGAMCAWYSALCSCLHFFVDSLPCRGRRISLVVRTASHFPPSFLQIEAHRMYLEPLLLSPDTVIGRSCKTRLRISQIAALSSRCPTTHGLRM